MRSETKAVEIARRLATQTETRLAQLREWRLTRPLGCRHRRRDRVKINDAVAGAAQVLEGEDLWALGTEQARVAAGAAWESERTLQEIEDALARSRRSSLVSAVVATT